MVRQFSATDDTVLQGYLTIPIKRFDFLKHSQTTTPTAKMRAARGSLLDFIRYTMPDYQVNWHHRVVCREIDRWVAGDITRLMLFMPPRYGKSEAGSRRLPAYIMGRFPDASIIATSYSADLAGRMNRDVQRIMDDDLYRAVFPNTSLYGKNIRTVASGTWLRNSEIFEVVGHKGVYRSAGVGGGITGMGGQFIVIDDPIKNQEEADSETYREKIWDWYTSTLYTRLEKNGRILLILTRWHEDDLAGRLLSLAESDPAADQWHVVTFPAICEHEQNADDPRKIGEPLWPEKYDLKAIDTIKASVGSRVWNALYQQRPSPPDGGMFKRQWFEIVDVAPFYAQRVRYWDKAGSEGKNDYTCGTLFVRDTHNQFFVEDVVRGQWSSLERESIIKQTAVLDDTKYGMVEVWQEQEPGSGGKESAESTVRNLAGHIIHTERVTGSKATRALPFAAQAEARNVKLVRGAWNAAYIEELASFPFGTHDDQVDASSGAFNKLAAGITDSEARGISSAFGWQG